MSGISRETVAHLAQLARIDLTPRNLTGSVVSSI